MEALRLLGPDCEKTSSMVIIGNGKTGKSIESGGGCPLMKTVVENGKQHVTSPVCPSCYAVAMLNNYPAVRKVVQEGKHSVYDIILMAANMHPTNKSRLSGQPVFPGDRLRLYGCTDFSPMNMGTIRMLAKVYQLDIISKTLWMGDFNRGFLVELAKLPGINISLSFNKALPNWEKSMADTEKFVLDNGIGHSVGLNYTFTTSYRKTLRSEVEPIRDIRGVGVYHITSHDKHKITAEIGAGKVCGVFTEAGKPITEFEKGGQKGSCLGCNYCRDNTLNKVLGIKLVKRRKKAA